jgi:hypothetical protein
MANPTVTASLDKSIYRPGETMTLTVTYNDTDRETVKVTVQVTDMAGNQSPAYIVNATVDQLTLSVTDTARAWTKKSDTGSVAVYTAVA